MCRVRSEVVVPVLIDGAPHHPEHVPRPDRPQREQLSGVPVENGRDLEAGPEHPDFGEVGLPDPVGLARAQEVIRSACGLIGRRWDRKTASSRSKSAASECA